MDKQVTDYRSRLYSNYASRAEKPAVIFDEIGAQKWSRNYRYYLRDWLPVIKEARIIDLACGSGRFLYFLKSMGYLNISGIDVSPIQVHLAKQVIPDVQQVDIFAWSAGRHGKYDLITGFDILEHFTKQEIIEFLDVCFSVLNPGGKIILQTINCDNPWGNSIRYGDFSHEVGFTPSSLSRLLELSGFTDIEYRETGPVPYGNSYTSTCRYLIWQVFRSCYKLWNLVETGNSGTGIFTRVMIVTAHKSAKASYGI